MNESKNNSFRELKKKLYENYRELMKANNKPILPYRKWLKEVNGVKF